MRIVAQRVDHAVCQVSGEVTGEIDKGLLVFLGIGQEDDEDDLGYLVDKVLGLRIFEDDDEKMNLDIEDVNGGIMVIPQFTLYGDVRKGNRPSFNDACSPEKAQMMFNRFLDKISNRHPKVESGRFAEMMNIKAENNGPVTILVDSDKTF